jgi:tetratricopeptide (TPR) repeat protein
MRRKTLTLFVILFLSITLPAQYSAEDSKKIEKSKEFYQKEKYDKAIDILSKVQENYYLDNELWQLRVIYEYQRYTTQYNADIQDLIKKANSPRTYKIDFDKLPSSQYRKELLGSCIVATLFCEKQGMASNVLFDKVLSKGVDTTISDETKEIYEEGDKEFSQENYSAAIKQYQKAIREDSTYYNATLSIGMAYYKQEEWEKAIPWYQKAAKMQPTMLKPHIDMVECYTKLKRWDDAYNACIEGIVVYPSNSLFESLSDICDRLGKTFNRHWMTRTYYPNRMNMDQAEVEKEPWSFYRQAKNKMEDYVDEDGIITKTQSMTEQKFLESYSWEYMLKKDDSDEKEMGFARRMQETGYLDCYVFVSLYHIYFREQYVEFSKNNAERIRTYIKTQLVK